MVLLFNKKSDSNETTKPESKPVDSPSAELAKLKSEEQQLQIQKLRLIDQKEKMEQKLNKEVEARRVRISILKAEIPGLEKECKSLASALEIPPSEAA